MRFLLLVVIWIAGCAIADYVFYIEANAYAMLWGYLVGSIGHAVAWWME